MKRQIINLALTLFAIVSLTAFSSCREQKSNEEKLKDGIEKVGEDIEEGVEKVGDEIEEGAKKVGDKIEDATDDN
ncbi:hypothetical protein U1E44_14510 [Arenibacter sp. GZD96]|uniref:hypothetical protein n=1 Tax=Aurantibrevibacter litoralis TaxID=3106030 RepID=UPI002AFEF08B|nr:hypothetical protein [Arenibacter sp. GZD-96]MEA1787311.1 hypothetical protein [Arenibacter sp. GZD-96]